MFTGFALRALLALFAFLAVVDGDGVRVAEADGVAYHLASLLHGRHGGDIIRRVQQLLQGGDVVVHPLLPLLQRGQAFLVLVEAVPDASVQHAGRIVIASRKDGDEEGQEQEAPQSFHCLFHTLLYYVRSNK